jgi:aryl-alcohol dehydrogenase-like predicted oxidoreductase
MVRDVHCSNDSLVTSIHKVSQPHKLILISQINMALAFINQRPFVASNIIGATNLGQLESNISSLDVTLSNGALKDLELVGVTYSNPCP